jgi:ribosomal protein S27AE
MTEHTKKVGTILLKDCPNCGESDYPKFFRYKGYLRNKTAMITTQHYGCYTCGSVITLTVVTRVK